MKIDEIVNENEIKKDENLEKQKTLINILFQQSRGRETRIKILQALNKEPMNCNQLSQRLKFSWKSINHHLRILHRIGCIEIVKPFKRSRFYNITKVGEKLLNVFNHDFSINKSLEKNKELNNHLNKVRRKE